MINFIATTTSPVQNRTDPYQNYDTKDKLYEFAKPMPIVPEPAATGAVLVAVAVMAMIWARRKRKQRATSPEL